MTIRFLCHGCRREFNVPDSLAGTKAQCNSCGAVLTVPLPGGIVPLNDSNLEPLPGPGLAPSGVTHPAAMGGWPGARQPSQAESGGLPPSAWAAIGIGGGAVVLILLALLISSRMRAGPAPKPVAVSPAVPPSAVTVPAQVASPVAPSVVPPVAPLSGRPATPANSQGMAGFGNNTTANTTETAAAKGMPGTTTTPPAATAPKADGTATASASSPPPGAAVPATTPVPPAVPRERAKRPRSVPSGFAESAAQEESESPRADLVRWSMPPDPPAQPVVYGKTKVSIPLAMGGEVVFPVGPSNFVLAREAQGREFVYGVYDLRTNKPIGKPVRVAKALPTPLFSADGRYMAAVPPDATGSDLIGVWSFAKGDSACVLDPQSQPRRFLFAAAHQLLTIESRSGTAALIVWDLTQGTQVREIVIPAERSHKRGGFSWGLLPAASAVSPGGRFATVVIHDTLRAYDLQSGECVGSTVLPESPRDCLGVAFTPDGTRVAGVFHGNRDRFLCWDVATGELKADRRYDDSFHSIGYPGPPVDWLPDGNALLLCGKHLLDGGAGGVVWTFPDSFRNARRMLSMERILTVQREPRRHGEVLVTLDLPAKEIAKGMEAVRSGGEAIDSALPALSTANLLSAKPVELPNGFVDWHAPPDTPPAEARTTQREVLVAKAQESPEQIMFAGPGSGKVVVLSRIHDAKRRTEKNQVKSVTIATGRASAELDLPTKYRLLDASPTGDFVLIGLEDQQAFDRLDVLGLQPKKHVAGWRPYGSEDAGERRGEQGNKVTWAAFTDDEHVLTCNGAGKLILWKLPDCEAVYIFAKFGKPLAVSSGRKYLFGVHDAQCRLFATATGECVGDLATPQGGSVVQRVGFRPDGRELAAIVWEGSRFSVNTKRSLVLWNLTDGRITAEFPLPPDRITEDYHFGLRQVGSRMQRAQRLEYCDDRYLLLDQQYLINLDGRAVVWRYVASDVSLADGRFGDQAWQCVKRGGSSFNAATLLTPIALPSAGVRGKSEKVKMEDQLAIYPGAQVRLLVDVGGVGQPNAQEVATRGLTEALRVQGLSVAATAPVTIALKAERKMTGTKLVVTKSTSPFGRGAIDPSAPTLDQQQIECTLTVTEAAGKILWYSKGWVSMRSYGRVENVQTVAADLEKEMLDNFTGFLEGRGSGADYAKLDPHIFRVLDDILAGQSRLTPQGEEDLPLDPKMQRVAKVP